MFWKYNPKLDYHSFQCDNYVKNEKITLALFNFYGTIAWSNKGEIISFSYDNLLFSSPVVDLIISSYDKYGYTICILEVVKNKNIIEPVKRCIQNFLSKYNIKANIIITSIQNFNKNKLIISKILYDFFNPTYKFGKKSFYCGDEIDYYDANPWFRLSDLDTKISNSIGFSLRKSNEIFGEFLNSKFYHILNDLVITCGHEYSGFDLDYESIEIDVIHLGMECKVEFFLGRRIYYILSEIFLEKYKDNKLLILQDEHYVIVGSHPSLEERQKIVSKFEKKETETVLFSVGWFSKYPYQWTSNYRDFITKFECPVKTGERWVRCN